MINLSYTSLRNNLANTMDRICADHDIAIITRNNNQSIVMMSKEDYESIIETNYLISNPANAIRIENSINEVEELIRQKKNK